MDGVMLIFHDVDERSALLTAAVPQSRPDMPVFSNVVLTQHAAYQRDVVGDQRGTLRVTGHDCADQAWHQPELATEHRVRREHIPWITERLVERRYRCHFMRPSTDAIEMLFFEAPA
jgi:hypothetical protein